ncbi:MAG TPA: LytR C-terminal domain-containing protein [Acidothermaceae bacterium]
MTEPAEGRLAGQHRRATGSRLVGLLVSLALVVIAGVGVYVTLHWRGEGTRPPAQGASSASHHPSASATHSSPSASRSSIAPSAAASSTAAPAASSTASAPASSTALAAPTAPSAPASKIPVDILNDTHISGLAAKAEKTLTSGGWTVPSTGNYAHTVTQTTVYYQPGQQASAQLLATQFPKIHRVLAAPSGLVAGHLTLVLAQDWA